MTISKTNIHPEKRFSAACGLFCPACTVYIGTQDDPARLEYLASTRFNLPIEDLQCDGCGGERRGFYCRQCKMVTCTREKGIEFCHECEEYPCEDLKTFQAEMPHRIELWENLARIGEAGFDTWFAEKANHYACPECGVLNSTYDLSCRKCGYTPSCRYVEQHREVIEQFIKERT